MAVPPLKTSCKRTIPLVMGKSLARGLGKPLHVAGALLIYCLYASIKLVRQLQTLFLPSVPDSKSHVSGGGFHHGMGRDSREITLQNGEFSDIAILQNKAPPVHFSHIAHSLFLVLHTLVSKHNY